MTVVGVGVDAVDIERFSQMLQRTPSTRDRIFTSVELDYVAPFADPVPSLAARFAAREAAMKCLGVGIGAFGMHDVWVRNEPSGRPILVLEGAARDLALRAGIAHWTVSLTHTSSVAIAFVVASSDAAA